MRTLTNAPRPSAQAPDNEAQSRHALDFGECFSELAVRPRPQKVQSRAALVRHYSKLLREAEARSAKRPSGDGGGGGGGAKVRQVNDKYGAIRAGQVVMCTQILAVLARFDDS